MGKLTKLVAAAATVSAAAGASILAARASNPNGAFKGQDYTIPEIDLSVMPEDIPEEYKYLYEQVVVEDSGDYYAHPDSVLLRNNNILTFYPAGHGKGAILNKVSTDGGKSYSESIKDTPKSWEKSLETPTVYRLEFKDGSEKLILVSANSKWPGMTTPGGFNCSISEDEGQTWSEFKTFFNKETSNPIIPIVAMASLTRLKEHGEFVDKWMGFFHDSKFNNYKSILTFNVNGEMEWSTPERYFSKYSFIEKKSRMCEVEVIRSKGGKGGELALITRSNTKKMNSLISFSQDEGKNWSKPRELPAALSGERIKADYLDDGRLFIVFRSIERGPRAAAAAKTSKEKQRGWMSEGWVAWVGTYEDLKKGREGQYRIKLAHTYLAGQKEPQYSANADTGYCGTVVMPDGTVVTSTYGCFDPNKYTKDGSKYRTSIVSKRVNVKDVESLYENYLKK